MQSKISSAGVEEIQAKLQKSAGAQGLIKFKRELMPTTVATEVSIESISKFTNSQNQERRRSQD